jgi:hypothetical protein
MKYMKMLGLMAVAAAAMMAFSAVASATVVTSPAGTAYTSTIKAASEGTHVKLTGPLGIAVECASTVEGKVNSHGAGVTAVGTISSLTFTGCTNGYTATALKNGAGNFGTLEVHTLTNGNGTLTSTLSEVTVTTPLGFNCIYKTNATDIGTLTGSKTTGKTATLDINAATIPRTGHSAFCGASGSWTGNYLVSTPDYLDIS